MQEKNQAFTKYTLGQLAIYLNVKGIKGLAVYLGENVSKLYSWIKNGNIADTGVILAKHPEINIEWLKTGKGPMLREIPNNQSMAVNAENITNLQQNQGPGTFNYQTGQPHQSETMQNLNLVPVIRNTKRLGTTIELAEENVEYLSMPGVPENCFAYVAQDEAMLPTIALGDYVVFAIDKEAEPGNIVIVNNEFSQTLIRRYLIADNKKEWLVADNHQYPRIKLNNDNRIRGVVVKGWRPLNNLY